MNKIEGAPAEDGEGLVATRITNIKFEKPADMYPGDKLTVVFEYKPDGMDCVMTLTTADGETHIIGDEVTDEVI